MSVNDAAPAEAVYDVDVQADVRIPMRDGVELSANVFRPRAAGRFPAIVVRTPYGKGDAHDPEADEGRAWAARGYACVIQDCRGRGESAGQWTPFADDATDGLATHQWVLDQPWSNGRVGTNGGSYLGFTQWASAPLAGEYLKAMFTVVPLIDPYHDLAYGRGAFQLGVMMGWGAAQVGNRVALEWERDGWLAALPLTAWESAIGGSAPYLHDWLAHTRFDDYWRRSAMEGRWRDVTAPIYVACGWYDLYAATSLRHVNAVRAHSRSDVARRHQHVLMGPWTHGINVDRVVGDVDFGEDSLVDLEAIRTAWFDHWLEGRQTGVERWPFLRLFVMGRNQWRDEHEWPLARTRYTPYYLHSGGGANTLAGDGALDTDAPGREPADRFVYDPHDPAPTAGGCNLGLVAGPRDQTAVEQRDDVLVYTSDELTTELEVTGPVRVVLYAASTAADTDWTAKLVDVCPDGRAINLCDGIVRAGWRASAEAPTPIEPGRVHRYEIDLGVTSNVFLPGHRVRVEISSSNFPRFDRNPNTGHPFGIDAQLAAAEQTVRHDSARASYVLLPVVP